MRDGQRVIAEARTSLEALIKAQALGLGFDLVGITRTGTVESAQQFERWLAAGRAGTMSYLEKHRDVRADTRRPFDSGVSAVVVALNYGGTAVPGPIARYARGDDYHEVMWAKLDALHAWIAEHLDRTVRGKSYVDTGPLLERDLARRAGLGWFGKNTNIVNPTLGSFFFLGALLLDLELDSDKPFDADRCGSCTRCIDACPTDAIIAARELDATRCISYLTIELRGDIPLDLRDAMGDLLYGCDICQDVCPWNVKFARDATENAFASREVLDGKSARQLARAILAMEPDDYAAAFKGSAMKRAKLRGLKRNAAVVLGNAGTDEDIPILAVAANDAEPLVRSHANWALEKLTVAAEGGHHDGQARPESPEFRQTPSRGTTEQ